MTYTLASELEAGWVYVGRTSSTVELRLRDHLQAKLFKTDSGHRRRRRAREPQTLATLLTVAATHKAHVEGAFTSAEMASVDEQRLIDQGRAAGRQVRNIRDELSELARKAREAAKAGPVEFEPRGEAPTVGPVDMLRVVLPPRARRQLQAIARAVTDEPQPLNTICTTTKLKRTTMKELIKRYELPVKLGRDTMTGATTIQRASDEAAWTLDALVGKAHGAAAPKLSTPGTITRDAVSLRKFGINAAVSNFQPSNEFATGLTRMGVTIGTFDDVPSTAQITQAKRDGIWWPKAPTAQERHAMAVRARLLRWRIRAAKKRNPAGVVKLNATLNMVAAEEAATEEYRPMAADVQTIAALQRGRSMPSDGMEITASVHYYPPTTEEDF